MFITGFLVGTLVGTAGCLGVALVRVLAADVARTDLVARPALVRVDTTARGSSSLN